MPVYDYECDHCGPFSAMRPMADYRHSASCPTCDAAAPRVILSAPAMGLVSTEVRRAHGVNERAAHAPKTSAEVREAMREKKKAHGAGCSCCGGSGKPSKTAKAADGSKSFPAARPWMISH